MLRKAPLCSTIFTQSQQTAVKRRVHLHDWDLAQSTQRKAAVFLPSPEASMLHAPRAASKEEAHIPRVCWDSLQEEVRTEMAGPDVVLLPIWKQNVLTSKSFSGRLSP